MPQLQALRIETPGFREAELDSVSFASLAERSPLLSSLSIVLSAFTNQNLLEALRLFPALETLDTIAGPDHTRFTAFPTTADLLALLRNTQPPVCPSLKNLLVRSIPVPHYDALLSFLRTRLDPQHIFQPLEDLQIDYSRRRPGETLPGIQPFLARGVRILLTYKS
jgi:hypothetical protein